MVLVQTMMLMPDPKSGINRHKMSVAFRHRYVELESKQSWHMKASIVYQAEGSRYNLTETQLGGMMTRHDLTINQVRCSLFLHQQPIINAVGGELRVNSVALGSAWALPKGKAV